MGTWRAEGRGRRGCSTPGSDQMLPQLRTPKDSIYLTRCLLLLTFSYMAKQFGVQNSMVLPAITVKRFCIISQKALSSLSCLPAPLRTAEVAMISAAAPQRQQTPCMQRLQRKAFGSCKWEVLLRNKKLHSDGLERVLCCACTGAFLPRCE